MITLNGRSIEVIRRFNSTEEGLRIPKTTPIIRKDMINRSEKSFSMYESLQKSYREIIEE